MKKLLTILLALMTVLPLAACTADEEPQVHTASLYAVFSYSSEDSASIREYPFEYTGDVRTATELAADLSELTGLDFTISATEVDDGWAIDWADNSTLLAGLDEREMKEDFTFADADSLRWFMMDSLWRTLTENLYAENIYYTMNGGEPLTFAELSPIREFPTDTPYMGYTFYMAHSGNRGDDTDEPNLYYDPAADLLLTYPNDFAASGTLDDNGIMHFPTMWDAGFVYWAEANGGSLSPSAFFDAFTVTDRMALSDNIVIAYGEAEDESGNTVPVAYMEAIYPDVTAHVLILCTDPYEAPFWYEQFQDGAFHIEYEPNYDDSVG